MDNRVSKNKSKETIKDSSNNTALKSGFDYLGLTKKEYEEYQNMVNWEET